MATLGLIFIGRLLPQEPEGALAGEVEHDAVSLSDAYASSNSGLKLMHVDR